MIQTVLYPGREDYAALLQRPHKDAADLGSIVAGVLHDVRREGDTAVLRYEEKFDKVCLASLAVSEEEIQEAEHLISDELKNSIRLAHANIHRFHYAQRMQPVSVETAPGVHCWQK